MPAATDRDTAFSLDLLRVVATRAEDNVVVSPWSVASALAVLAPGIDDPARREIVQALAAPAGDDEPASLPEVMASQARQLVGDRGAAPTGSGDEDAVLVVANSLWVDESRTPRADFVRHLDRWPGAGLRPVPLSVDPEAARELINRDVARTTRDLIPQILPPGSITRQERAVVVNALYLLAGWVERFKAADTVDEPFQTPSRLRKVPTMRGFRDVPYAPGDWQYLALPVGLGLTAEVLLPPAGTAAPVDTVDAAVLVDGRQRARRHRVDLHLPRFRVERHLDLVPPLRRLGVARIFDRPALVDVVAEECLQVSGAYHAAVLRVDERGIEGAAATALVARAVAFVELPEVEVRVDRPFVFLVSHRRTGVVLFAAQVAEP